jgi:hypothetical protein
LFVQGVAHREERSEERIGGEKGPLRDGLREIENKIWCSSFELPPEPLRRDVGPYVRQRICRHLSCSFSAPRSSAMLSAEIGTASATDNGGKAKSFAVVAPNAWDRRPCLSTLPCASVGLGAFDTCCNTRVRMSAER